MKNDTVKFGKQKIKMGKGSVVLNPVVLDKALDSLLKNKAKKMKTK